MKGWFSPVVLLVAALLLAAAACSTSVGGPAPPSGLVYWPPGRYALEASIQYERSTAFEEGTVTTEYFAQVLVTPNGSIILTTSSGSCQDPIRSEVRRNESLGRRSFECGDVTYHLRPEGEKIGGEIVVSVQETKRERGRCFRYITGRNGLERCVESSWRIQSRKIDKRGRLKVTKGT